MGAKEADEPHGVEEQGWEHGAGVGKDGTGPVTPSPRH